MTHSTTDEPKVQARDPLPVAHAVTQKILKNRSTLPRAMNGRPAPLASKQAAQIRKHLQQGLSTPVRQLLTVLADDLRCGVPLSTILSALDDMRAYLELCAGDQPNEARDFAVWMKLETRAGGRLDLAQISAMAKPGCPDALAQVIASYDAYRAVADKMVQNARVQLAVAQVNAPRYEVMR